MLPNIGVCVCVCMCVCLCVGPLLYHICTDYITYRYLQHTNTFIFNEVHSIGNSIVGLALNYSKPIFFFSFNNNDSDITEEAIDKST